MKWPRLDHLPRIEIGHFAAESDQGESIESNHRDRGNAARGIILAFRGIPGHGSQHRYCYGVRRHPHIEENCVV